MRAAEFDEAEDTLKRALGLCSIPVIVNNLATVYRYTERYEEALVVLEPVLTTGDDAPPNPYGHALAAQCLFRLGELDRATAAAERAVKQFDAGRPPSTGWVFSREQAEWFDHATSIFKAFGDLGNHLRVWKLYQDWQTGIRDPAACYYAGVAAFNLGRYGSAEVVWRQVGGRDWMFLEGFRFVAHLCESDNLPMPILNYEPPSNSEKFWQKIDLAMESGDTDSMTRLFLEHSPNVLVVLGRIFAEEPSFSDELIIQEFVFYGEQWGEEFGRRLLLARRVSDDLKMAAARALVDRGLVDPETPVRMVLDGETHDVLIRNVPINLSVEATQESLAQHEHLTDLFEQGDLEGAREGLEELIYGDGETWARLVMLYVDVLRKMGDNDEAERWFNVLNDQLPGDPVIQVNFALFRVQQGQYDEARQLLDGLNLEDASPEVRAYVERACDRIINVLRLLRLPEMLAARGASQMMEKAEDKPLSPDRTPLQSALRKIPVQWLNAACEIHGLPEPASRRREREGQLADLILQDPAGALANLAVIEHEGSEDALPLIAFLLEEGGWAKKRRVTSRFGADDEDGFYWLEAPPISTLGLLRMAGLVFVGRTSLNGKRCKVVSVPIDLRDPLREALAEM